MPKTCIVCLEDLGESASDSSPLLSTTIEDPDALEASRKAAAAAKEAARAIDIPEDKLIAHLLPCNHNLHNECLKPWVERANSCPICRQSFNMVELCQHLDGQSILTSSTRLILTITDRPSCEFVLSQ